MDSNILSPRVRRIARRLESELEISQSPPTLDDLGYLAREFIMCTLPHKDPGVHVWTARNGFYTLSIQTGFDANGEPFGIPYGPIPRLFLVWVIREALRSGPSIELGASFAEFLRKLGYSSYTGRGPRGDATRVMEQIIRFCHCLISFSHSEHAGSTYYLRMLPVEGYVEIRFDGKRVTRLELGQRFYDSIRMAPVPLDLRVLGHIKHSSLALDLYCILVRESGRAARAGSDRFIAWEWLHAQIGTEYAQMHHFRTKAMAQLDTLVSLCPRLIFSVQKGGRGRKSGLVVSVFSEPVPTMALPS